MAHTDSLVLVEAEWEVDSGFLWKLRQGEFDQAGFERLRTTLQSLTFDADAMLPRRFVSVLWYIPLFMEWQRQRLSEAGNVLAFSQAASALTTEVERLLGTP